MKQSELWFGFTLVLDGDLGAVEAQREIPAGLKLLSSWGLAAFAVMQKVPPVLPTPEGPNDAHLPEMPNSFLYPKLLGQNWSWKNVQVVSRLVL